MKKAKILLVAATLPEILPTIESFFFLPSDSPQILTAGNLTALVTGVGMVNTAYHLGKYLAVNTPDFAINAGIAGTFDPLLPLGSVVEITEDSFSEMGAENHEDFLTLEQMGFSLLESQNTRYFNTFSNPSPSRLAVPKVSAITVNTVHGSDASILTARKRWNKQVETMEGAAFFQIMTAENIPFCALRGISNDVEPRNRANWNIRDAVINMNALLIDFLKEKR